MRKNKILLIATIGLFLLNLFLLFIFNSIQSEWESYVIVDNTERHVLSIQKGSNINYLVTHNSGSSNEKGEFRHGNEYNVTYKPTKSGYIIKHMATDNRKAFSVKLKSYRLNSECAILLFNSNDAFNMRVPCIR